jgi:hypothetical protein
MKQGYFGLPVVSFPERPALFTGEVNALIATFFRSAKTLNVWNSILMRLSQDRRAIALEGTMVGSGASWQKFDVSFLAIWWIWRANEVGIEIADRNLDDYLSNTTTDALMALWVYGLRAPKRVALFDGIELIPTEEMPLSRDQEEFMRQKYPTSPSQAPYPHVSLVKRIQIPRSISDKQLEQSNEPAAVGVSQKQLREVALLLNCLHDTMCFGAYSTSYCPTEVPLGVFGGGGGGFTVTDFVPRGANVFDVGRATELEKLFSAYQTLPEATATRIARAIQRFAQAKGRSYYWDTALDLGIALEMVLLDDQHRDDLPGQLHVQFRLRGSWLVGQDATHRVQVFKTLGEIYKHRSQVAHTGICPSIDKLSPEKRHSMFDRHFLIAEQVFTQIILRGIPADWNALLLGSGEQSADTDRH